VDWIYSGIRNGWADNKRPVQELSRGFQCIRTITNCRHACFLEENQEHSIGNCSGDPDE
jgi:hypothetical protein